MGTAFKMLLALIPVFTSVLLITSSNAVRPPATADAAETVSEVLEDAITVEVENNFESFDQKAAPWWEQQEEAAKRKCQSSCTMHSKGVKAPQISLCDDTDVCPINRKSVEVYASSQCEAWSKILGEGVLTGEGRQVVHQPVKGSWLSCAVFCKTSSGAWHSPRKELENLNVDPYFPDGVWCHVDRESNTNYYCQNHLCMPGNVEHVSTP